MTDVDASSPALFAGAGEMRARCRAYDWSSTPLGPVDRWPQSLRTAAGTVLATGFPCILLWGRSLIQIYNDAYVPIIGSKHPRALGHGNEEVWPEVWGINGPIFERVLGGETVTLEDRLYPLLRRGPEHPPEEVYLTLSYSPVPDESGGVGGVIITMFETTGQVALRTAQAERDASRGALEVANAHLQEQSLELELTNQQLQDNAAELEATNEELQSATEELAERTAAAEHAAAALAESEARYRLAAEATELGTWTWDLRTDAATFDARVREIFGFEHDDPWPRVEILTTRVHAGDRERVAAALAAATDPAGNGRYDAEFRVVRPGGSERWALASGVMRFEGEGEARRPSFLIGAVLDVTERRRAEAALAESERQWRTVADAIPTLAWTARADGYLDWYNARWYEYTGTTPAEMEGWGWQSVHDPAELPLVVERWRMSIATGEPFEMTFPLRGADGRFRPFLTRITPMRDAAGRVVRWFGTNTNVEAERMARAEAEAARAEAEAARARADQANRAKSEFLAAMSHELRTPLNAIAGYVQLLQLGLRGPLTDAQSADLARIQRSQQHLLGLINDVLNFAKLESGHVRLDVADVRLEAVLEDLETLIVPQVRANGLTFVAPERVDSLAVRADAEKLRQVLLNVLTNAIKFTDAPGEIAIECEAADESAGAVVRVRVRDTGIGIPAEKLDAIFEPFVQVDPGLTRAREGTGLGLAISRDLARRMGGDLTVESATGAGSVFTLTLPRALGLK